MQDEAEPAAFARRDGEPARCREIGLPACQFRHDGSHGAAFECLLHGPQGIPRARHPQNGETPHGQTHELEPRPVRRARLRGGKIRLDPQRLSGSMQCPYGQRRQRHDETRRRAAMQRCRRADLMQGPAGKAAREHLIE